MMRLYRWDFKKALWATFHLKGDVNECFAKIVCNVFADFTSMLLLMFVIMSFLQASHSQQCNHSNNNNNSSSSSSSSNRMPWPTWLWQCLCHRYLGMSGTLSLLAGTRCKHAGALAKVSSARMESLISSQTTPFVDSRSGHLESIVCSSSFRIMWKPWFVLNVGYK